MSVKRKVQAGFSLVEVLVALTIFLIASLGLMSLLVTGMRVGQYNVLHGEARRVAGEALAALQIVDYEALPSYNGLPSSEGEIRLLRTVERDLPAVGQTRLTVTASWQRAGQEHSYQLQTLRSRP